MSRITHSTLPKPDMSCRRKRSLAAVMNSQNHKMNMNTAKASATKVTNGDSPRNDMISLPSSRAAVVQGLAESGLRYQTELVTASS
jgi:hypothetical protein